MEGFYYSQNPTSFYCIIMELLQAEINRKRKINEDIRLTIRGTAGGSSVDLFCSVVYFSELILCLL